MVFIMISRFVHKGQGSMVVETIRNFSVKNKACKIKHILYALALCCCSNDPATKDGAYRILPAVCRTPTHLFQFIKYHQDNKPGKGWGRALRRGVSKWYKSYGQKRGGNLKLAIHMTKYKARCGFTHKDVFRLCHIKTNDEVLGYMICYVCQGKEKAENSRLIMEAKRREGYEQSELKKVVNLLQVFEDATRCTDEQRMARLIMEHECLVREHVPTGFLKSKKVWEALVRHMPMKAMIRSLGKLSSLSILERESFAEAITADKLINQRLIESARIHPFSLLVALKSYSKGQSEYDRLQWVVNPRVEAALEEAFYLSFEYVQSTGKRYLLAVDVSDSMSVPVIGTPSLTVKEAAAAMMMTTVRTEERCDVVAFSMNQRHGVNHAGTNSIAHLSVSPQDDLCKMMCTCSNITPGRIDCAAPILDAIENKKMYDVFVVYTDSETSYGPIHPSEALKRYRKVSGIRDARLIVCGMASTGFSIADRNDPLMLDIVGFDSGAPMAIHEFVSGEPNH